MIEKYRFLLSSLLTPILHDQLSVNLYSCPFHIIPVTYSSLSVELNFMIEEK